jgi:raffinose/stachyose/melibiose transport system substrate-binding protein
MKKVLLLLGVLFLVGMSAYAQGKTTLRFLYYIDASQAGYAEDQQFWQKFKDANPDIDLQMEILFSQAYHQKLGAYIAAGQMPDVVYMWPGLRDSSATIHNQKLTWDLRDALGKDYLSSFLPTALDPNQQASKQVLELPQSFTYCDVLYANKKLLKENGFDLPKTWADVKKMVMKLKMKNIQTVLLPDNDKWPAESCFFSTVVGRLLGDSWVDQVQKGKVKFTDKGFVDALKFYESLYKDGIIDKSNVQLGYGDGPGLFAAGKAAFIIDGDWRVGAYVTDKSTGKALIAPADQKDYALLNLPAIAGEKNPGAAAAIAGVGLGISKTLTKGSPKFEAAVKLIKWYYSKEFQTMKLETGAFIPTRKDVTSDKLETLQVKLPEFYAANQKTCYVIDGVLDPSVFNVLNDGLQAIGLGVKTPAEVAAEMQKAQDLLLKK